MILLLISLPLIASLISGVVGRHIGVTGTNIVVVGSLLISSLLSLIVGYEVILTGSNVTLNLGVWIDTGLLRVEWAFLIDPLSSWLTSTILVVSLLVHVFATSYMSSDPSPQRFMSLLVAFTGFMVLLVTGDNFAVLFLGWEGIGVTSFLLIGYWWDRSAACNAASQAMIVNRVGDTVFTVALLIFICSACTLDLTNLNFIWTGAINSDSFINHTLLTWTGVLIVLAAFGKSAQFLLHTWLPSAMEGPTPVSSLLHAATLVAAGIYLLVRSSLILGQYALILAAVVGTITAIFAASTALVQSDMKRIIAYSTCSQFGYLTASVGLGQTSSTILHLSSHAGFKALLFVCAGACLHSMRDEQDLRRLGGLVSYLPFTYAAMLIGSLSIIAFPYMSGHVSKDLVLELAASQFSASNNFFWITGSIVAGLTAAYSVRLLAMVFIGGPNTSRIYYETTHDQPVAIIVPMIFLAFFASTFGYFAADSLVGMGSESLGLVSSQTISLGSQYGPFEMAPGLSLVEAEFGLSLLAKSLPLICTVVGLSVGLILFVFNPSLEPRMWQTSIVSLNIHRSLANKWWMDAFIARFLVWPTFNLGLFGSKLVDRGIIEYIGPQGLNIISNVPFGINIVGKYATYVGGNLPYYAIYTALVALAVPILFTAGFSVLEIGLEQQGIEIVSSASSFINSSHTLFLFALILALSNRT